MRSALQVIEPDRIDHPAVKGQGAVPVDLVDEREPGEPQHRHALPAQVVYVEELLPQPARGVFRAPDRAGDPVGLGVHHRVTVAPVVLAGDDVPAEDLPRRLDAPARRHQLLVALVEVVAHHDPLAQAVAHKPGQLFARQAVVQQIERNLRARGHRVEEVEGEEAALVLQAGPPHAGRVAARGVEVLGALALDDDGVRAHAEQLPDGQQVGPAEVLEGRDEGPVVLPALVPQALQGGQLGADVDLVHRRVVAHPGEARGERPGEAGEVGGPVRVLEIAGPIGHPEVAEVDDGDDPQAPHLGQDLVRELPVVAVGASVHPVVRGAVAQVPDPQAGHQRQVLAPVGVVERLLQLVHADAPPPGPPMVG